MFECIGVTSYVKIITKISTEKIAIFDYGTIIILNIENWEILKKIDANSFIIRSIFRLSNNKIYSCSDDKFIKLWNLELGICLKIFEVHEIKFRFIEFKYFSFFKIY